MAGGILLIVSVGWVVGRLVTDEDALEALRSVHPGAIAGLVVLQAAYLLPQAYRYRLALEQTAGAEIPLGAWLRLFVVGRFLNSLLPQAGNVYRGLRLKEDFEIPITRYLSGFVAFTWLSTLLNLAVALGVIAVVEPDLAVGSASGLGVTGIILLVAAAGPPGVLWLIRRFHLRRGVWGWAHRRFEDLLAAAVSVARSSRTMVRFVAVGLIGLALALGMFALSFEALGLDASLAAVTLFFVILQVGTYVNVTPGNLGVMEIGFGALGSQIGVGLVGGLMVAALIRITGYVALLVAGVSLGGTRALERVRTVPPPDQTGR